MINKIFELFFVKCEKKSAVYFRKEKNCELLIPNTTTLEKVKYSTERDCELHEERVRKMFNLA